MTVVQGYVKDKASEQPVVGATVRANNGFQEASSSTNDSGYYYIDGLIYADYWFTVSATGYNSIGKQFSAGRGVARYSLDFQLEKITVPTPPTTPPSEPPATPTPSPIISENKVPIIIAVILISVAGLVLFRKMK